MPKNLTEKVIIPDSCCPSFYTTYDDLNTVNIGDVITVTFKDKGKVKNAYRGQSTKFLVNNYMEHNWRRPTRRLALIPLDRINYDKLTFSKNDVIILDDSDRFECLMIDLFKVNRVPFKGWKKKIVEFTISEETLTSIERDHKLRQI